LFPVLAAWPGTGIASCRCSKSAALDAIAVDLPGDDEHAALSAYDDRVIDAIGARHVILVPQSFAGFTAPISPLGRRLLVERQLP
jgi:hypothetical protein